MRKKTGSPPKLHTRCRLGPPAHRRPGLRGTPAAGPRRGDGSPAGRGPPVACPAPVPGTAGPGAHRGGEESGPPAGGGRGAEGFVSRNQRAGRAPLLDLVWGSQAMLPVRGETRILEIWAPPTEWSPTVLVQLVLGHCSHVDIKFKNTTRSS